MASTKTLCWRMMCKRACSMLVWKCLHKIVCIPQFCTNSAKKMKYLYCAHNSTAWDLMLPKSQNFILASYHIWGMRERERSVFPYGLCSSDETFKQPKIYWILKPVPHQKWKDRVCTLTFRLNCLIWICFVWKQKIANLWESFIF